MSTSGIFKTNKLDNLDSVKDVGFLISMVKSAIVSSIDTELAPLELTAAQYRVVMILSYNGRSTLANLCEEMDYDRGAMSRLLCRLESKGLLDKKPCPEDKRSMYLTLSDKGAAFIPDILPKVNAVFNKGFNGFAEQEKEQLNSLLLRFLNNLKEVRNKE